MLLGDAGPLLAPEGRRFTCWTCGLGDSRALAMLEPKVYGFKLP